MSMSTRESHLPTWMVLVGTAVGIVGLCVWGYAHSKVAGAKMHDEFSLAYGSRVDTAARFVSMGHFGIGVLVFGALVAALGFTAMAVRSR